MSLIFGFDLGIASIGWAAVKMSDPTASTTDATAPDNRPVGEILGAGVRCFDQAKNATDRRMARSARRRIRHRAQRMRDIRKILRDFNLIDIPEPKSNGQNNFYLNRDTDINIWQLRAVDAFARKLTPRETGRILYHLAKHRGYDDITYPVPTGAVSEKPDDAESKEELKAIGAIKDNFAKLQRENPDQTMCQMLYATEYAQMRNGRKSVAKIAKDGTQKTEVQSSYSNSIPRSEIKREAEMILHAQCDFGNNFSDVFKEWWTVASRQRKFNESASPLAKSIEEMRGKCPFTNEPVAPKESPTAQMFVALTKCRQNDFTVEETKKVIDELYKKKTGLKYADVRELLKWDDDRRFKTLNYSRTYDKENKVWIEPDIKKIEGQKFYAFTGWHKLAKYTTDIAIMDKIFDIIATQKTPENIERAVSEILPEHAAAIAQITSSEFIKLSIAALQKIIPEMEKGKKYNEAVAAGLNQDFRAQDVSYINRNDGAPVGCLHQINWALLGNHITSPVARRTLAQLRKVYNAMVRRFGAPDKIHLEIGRELKNSPDDIARMNREQERNRQATEDARKEYGKNYFKYKLYMEQGGKCPYCGATLVAGDWDAYEIDHILPYSRSLDNSQSNKVLVCHECNQRKGSRTPYEFLTSEQFFDMTVRARAMHNPAKFKKLTNTDLPQNNDEQNGFIERNGVDNAIIARFATEYLEYGIDWPESDDIKKRVLVRTGSLTDWLRHQWGLVKNRDESDRHHAQDAIVIACATQGMVKYLSTLSARFENKYALIKKYGQAWYKVLKISIQEPWDGFRTDVISRLDDIIVSRPPRCNATGAAHDETIYADPKSYRSKRGLNKNRDKGSLEIRHGRAVRGNMFRFDIWRNARGKYVCVPIFVTDTKGKDDNAFKIPDGEFICSLHKDDYVRISTSDQVIEGYISQLKEVVQQNKKYWYLLLYTHDNKKNIVCKDGKTKAVSVIVSANVSNSLNIEKFAVSLLGAPKPIKLPERRTPVVKRK